ncbi:hypothetical protein AVEN_158399-1, partial [Araneus ventricosus]
SIRNVKIWGSENPHAIYEDGKDSLKIYLMPILKGRMPQQDGAPCHLLNEVTSYLNAEVPVWIGRGGVSPWQHDHQTLHYLISVHGVM